MALWSLSSTLIWGLVPVLVITVILYKLRILTGYKTYVWSPQLCSTDLTGKTAVVTGANSGIGKFVAQELALRGACVILACRSRERGQQALTEIQATVKDNGQLLLGEVDLSSMTSVRNFARWLLQKYPEIHLLVNNAAVSGLPKTLTKEGFELTLATNYLGHFLLTNLLQGALQRAGSARVVNVSSFTHIYGRINEKYLTGGGDLLKSYDTYVCSKLHLTSFSGELARRLQGTGVTVNCVDPGLVYTGIMKHHSWLYQLIFFLFSFIMKDAKQGAVPILYLCLAKELDGISGRYFSDSFVIKLPSEAAQDPHIAQRLWNTSARLTNLDKMD